MRRGFIFYHDICVGCKACSAACMFENNCFEPSCLKGCPSSAYSGNPYSIPDEISYKKLSWMPEKRKNPSLHLTGNRDISGPEIIPAVSAAESRRLRTEPPERGIKEVWSLILFSFLSALSVGLASSALLNDALSESKLPHVTIIAAALMSLLHLGEKKIKWRSVINIKNSPLSREIALLVTYSLLLISDLFVRSHVIPLASSITGLLLLLAIDNLYYFSTAGKPLKFHSGQAFLTGLLMISYFMGGEIVPFLFISAIKLVISLYFIHDDVNYNRLIPYRLFRIALLLITSAIFITGIGKGTASAAVIFLTGELFDRVLFYFDFKPENIKQTINNSPIEFKNEKTGS